MPRYTTLREIDEADLDLRLWCYHCQRATLYGPGLWHQFEACGVAASIEAATPHLPCAGCGACDGLIVPASRPRFPPPSERDAEQLVAGFFHAMRAASKRPRDLSPKLLRALAVDLRRRGLTPPPEWEK